MARYSTKNKTVANNQQRGTKVCNCCHKEKKLTDFYMSLSSLFLLDKRVPICKECCKSYALNPNGTINYVKLRELCMRIDKPLYFNIIDVSEKGLLREDEYLTPEAVKSKGVDILGQYFKNIVLPQYKEVSYSDSEKEGFVHSRTPAKEKARIIDKYRIPELLKLPSKFTEAQAKNEIQVETIDNEWTKKDIQNMNYVLSTVGYDPFTNLRLDDMDRKYCFNVMSQYCDIDGLAEDGNKLLGVIEIATSYCQCKKITETINTILSNSPEEVDEERLTKLTRAKTSLLSAINTIAKENNISSNNSKANLRGKNTLTNKMKEIIDNGFEDMKVNMFDINTAQSMKQIADLSNKSIMEQLTFDNNDYTQMIKEQREAIESLQNSFDEVSEENRILKNKIAKLQEVAE